MKREVTIAEAAQSFEKLRESIQRRGERLLMDLLEAYYNSSNELYTEEQLLEECAEDSSAEAARRKLFDWYIKHYGGVQNRRGVRRHIRAEDDNYEFDIPYSRLQFMGCLSFGSGFKSPSADFLLHMGVAFMLSPEALDALLNAYGYFGLHVRNIHHLSVYLVLKDIKDNLNYTDNPFTRVKELYFKARAELLGKEKTEAGTKAVFPEKDAAPENVGQELQFAADDSLYIHNSLIGRQLLTVKNFLHYIRSNPEIFVEQHKSIITEWERLLTVLWELYNPDTDVELDRLEVKELRYSLPAFLGEFCKQSRHRENTEGQAAAGHPLNRRDVRRDIFTRILSDGKHPTRELMIILWMYAYCFHFQPTVFCSYNSESMDIPVLAKLYGESEQSSERFCGQELLAYIQENLEHFGWGGLNRKNSFDSMFFCFADLDVNMAEDSVKATLLIGGEKQPLQLPRELTSPFNNVPRPLLIITEFLAAVKQQRQQKRLPLNDTLPLYNELYEQL